MVSDDGIAAAEQRKQSSNEKDSPMYEWTVLFKL